MDQLEGTLRGNRVAGAGGTDGRCARDLAGGDIDYEPGGESGLRAEDEITIPAAVAWLGLGLGLG